MKILNIGFRENLRDEIAYQGLQIKEVAAMANVSESSFLSYIDARERTPGVAVRIAQVLNVSVEYLITGKKTNASEEGEHLLRYKEFFRESSKLSEESWNKLQPLILAMVRQELKSEQEKKEKAASAG